MKKMKKKERKDVLEICRKCGKESTREEMTRIQTGFFSMWYCKDKVACHMEDILRLEKTIKE